MRTVVVVPTYQEAENIVAFLGAVRSAVPEADILVVDDNSPDGTGKLADTAALELGNISVLHREAKQGLGSAYRHGFATALAADYDTWAADAFSTVPVEVNPRYGSWEPQAGVLPPIGPLPAPAGS